MNSRALIIDDETALGWALQRALAREGFAAEAVGTAEAGLSAAEHQPPDVIFLDVRLPGIDGLTALGRLKAAAPAARVVIMTAYGDLATAVSAVQGGAFDYLTKPFDLSQAIRAAHRAVERGDAPPAGPAADGEEIVGRSAPIQEVFKRIALVASASVSVLVVGESGTGKELVARALHRYSPRATGPFIPVHAAALNPALVESELFGHARGAFTGAVESRPGLIALADGGTLFLDEVAEIPPTVQVKLLRVVETGEVWPVGADRPERPDVRFVAASSRDLTRLADEGEFRRDLMYRLNGFTIVLPPLRERIDDLELLVAHFLERVGEGSPPVPRTTTDYLRGLPWPGNVRELRNAVERAALLARGGPLLPDHFERPASTVDAPLAAAVRDWARRRFADGQPVTDLCAELQAEVEPALLDEVMQRTGGSRSAAAARLGIDRATVRKKLHLYGLDAGETESPD